MTACYLFDLDGTLADCGHRLRHIEGPKKDWRAFFAACGDDTPITHIARLAKTLWSAESKIVYVSGRSSECRIQTMQWIKQHDLPQAPLYMREEGDFRADDIVKGELLDQVIADGWEPIMAFDDRARVVAMWRARGIPCAQVAEGDF